MAHAKKGWRKLHVGHRRFHWRLRSVYGGEGYLVVADLERRSPQLRFTLEYLGGDALWPYQGPRVVRLAIDAARFTGNEPADITLPVAKARAINEQAYYAPFRRLLQQACDRDELAGLHCAVSLKRDNRWRWLNHEQMADWRRIDGPFRVRLERRLMLGEGRGFTAYAAAADADDMVRATERALVELDQVIESGHGVTRLPTWRPEPVL